MNKLMYRGALIVACFISAIMFGINVSCAYRDLNKSELKALILREVVINGGKKQFGPNIIRAKNLYTNYPFQLPDDVFINMDSALIINSDKIQKIIIAHPPWVPRDSDNYEIQIEFNSDYKDLYEFTKKNVNRRIALEIDQKLFMILNVMEPVRDSMAIPTAGFSKDDLIEYFKKIEENLVLR